MCLNGLNESVTQNEGSVEQRLNKKTNMRFLAVLFLPWALFLYRHEDPRSVCVCVCVCVTDGTQYVIEDTFQSQT